MVKQQAIDAATVTTITGTAAAAQTAFDPLVSLVWATKLLLCLTRPWRVGIEQFEC